MNLNIYIKGLSTLVTKRFLGPFWLRRSWLKRTQWYTKEQLALLQLKLLQRIVRHAYKTVPYYRSVMNSHGITVDAIRSLEDIKKFPVLTKQDIIACNEQLVSTKYPGFLTRTATTGGTTGIPTKIMRDVFSISNEHAFVRRQWDFAGIGLRAKCAFLTARELHKPGSYHARYYAYDPFMKELILSTYHLSPESAVDYLHLLKVYKVKAINGYPSALRFLAQVCLEKNIDVPLQAVLTTSETLTQEAREIIQKAFQCALYDYFGSAERVTYIQTCEHGSYHIIPEYGFTELIPLSGASNGACRVVATGFWNRAMPLIRYDMGDIVIPSLKKCACGRHYPTIEAVEGRSGDMIQTPSGIVLGVTSIIHMFYLMGQKVKMLEIQIIQHAQDQATIAYVPVKKPTAEEIAELEALVKKYIPEELRVSLQQVSAVSRTKSGKLRPIVSRI
jgi:phenylacetate-CoA ligase